MAEIFKAPRLDIIDAKALEALVFDRVHTTRVENADRLIQSPEDFKKFEAFAQNRDATNLTRSNTHFSIDDGGNVKTAAWNDLAGQILHMFGRFAWLFIIATPIVLAILVAMHGIH